ncbi:hypothetical protein GCM10022393_02410 [Aquimarina addita]|uniref:Uncharacterized protein n=1 Tax=Aquimarina addita TaxID=870485 RepID=A0ABP7X8G8_9FLAO
MVIVLIRLKSGATVPSGNILDDVFAISIYLQSAKYNFHIKLIKKYVENAEKKVGFLLISDFVV